VRLAQTLSTLESVLISERTENGAPRDELVGEAAKVTVEELGSLLRYFTYTVQSLVSSIRGNPGSSSHTRAAATHSATKNPIASSPTLPNEMESSLPRLQSFLSRFFDGIQPSVTKESQQGTDEDAFEPAADKQAAYIGNHIKNKLERRSKQSSPEHGPKALWNVRHALYWLSVVSRSLYHGFGHC
jgi:hypothetical protein